MTPQRVWFQPEPGRPRVVVAEIVDASLLPSDEEVDEYCVPVRWRKKVRQVPLALVKPL